MHGWTWLLWALSAILGVAAAAILYRALFLDRARGRRRCPRCWYDMAGSRSLQCPECGHQARSEGRLFRTRRRYGGAVLAIGLGLLSYAAALAPRAIASGSIWSAVPNSVLLIVLQFYDKDGDQLLKTAGNTALTNPTSLSRFERLLLSRACARVLREPRPKYPASTPEEQGVDGIGPQSSSLASSPQMQVYLAVERRRSQAVSILSSLGPEASPAVPILLKMLDSRETSECLQAVRCFGAIGAASPEVLPALARAMEGTSRDVRLSAIDALAQIASPTPAGPWSTASAPGTPPASTPRTRAAAGSILVRGLSAPDRATRRAVAAVLGRIGPPDPVYLSALAQSVRDPKLSTGEVGIAAVAAFGPECIPVLIDLLAHVDKNVRRTAASWIGQSSYPAPHAARPLATLLSDTDSGVRIAALGALGRLGSAAHEVLPEIAAARERDTNSHARLLAVIAAASAAGQSDAAVPMLTSALADIDPIVRRAAVDALGKLGPTARVAEDALTARADDPDADVQSAAGQALAAVRTAAPAR